MDCIFCKIVDGTIPSYKVYEDDKVLAFLDITQSTKGHTLIIPKGHYKNIYDLPEDVAAHLFSVVPMLANKLKKAFNPIGLNIVNNNEQPLQSVFHYHIHLIPRYKDDSFDINFVNNMESCDQEYFEEVLNTINNV